MNTFDKAKRKISIRPKKGQILMEALALVLFSCAFLAMLSHLYETGKKEIQLSRIGKSQK